MPLNIPSDAVQNSGEMFGNYQIQPEKGGRGIRLSDEYAMHLRRSYFAAVSYTDDHGWHLGDHTVWGKHTLFERSLRSAFMIRTPDMKNGGVANEAIVESVDIYPTLLELGQIQSPNSLSGKSLVPILKNPTATLDKPALGFWRNGYTLRTPKYRLTKFKEDSIIHTTLYDHSIDGNEATNLADLPEYSDILKRLDKQCIELIPADYWESL